MSALPKSITHCADGKYRWAYNLPMMKNPAILFTVYKVLAISALFPFLIVLIADGFKNFFGAVKVYLLVMLIMIVIGFIGYLIVAAIYGWYYCVIFEMDEEGINHAQQPKQLKKAQALAMITAFSGASAGNPTVTGAGLLAATKSGQYSQFDLVKTMKFYPRQHLIKLDYPLSHNQVYVEDDAYEFVADYIKTRCVGAREA